MKRWMAGVLLVVVASILTVAPAIGQTTFGSISGTVTDPSGAAVPGATVTVTNVGQGTIRQSTTGADGNYAVSNLLPGTYHLKASAPGFATHEVSGLVLSANQVRSADVQLTVGHASTTVRVSALSTVISTQTTSLSNVKTARDFAQIPAVSRQSGDAGISAFELMNPGASSTSGNSEVNVAGVMQSSVVPTMDGIAATANESNIGAGPIQPGYDAIQEMNFQLANTPAEFSTPANIAVVTKSGTNEFHGAIFENYNGNALNARQYFAKTVPFRVFNNFGVHVGGPIRKNKTFFFFDYEGARESVIGIQILNTPLPPWRNGDFSALSTPVIDPTTGSPFPGNKIPGPRINSVSQKTEDFFFPLPNNGAPGQQSGNYRATGPDSTGFTNYDSYDGRVDQNFRNGADKVFAHFNYRRMPIISLDAALPPLGPRPQIRTAANGIISWTHQFSSSVLNEARYGFTRQRNSYHTTIIGSDAIAQIGMQGVDTVGLYGSPAFDITGITSTNVPNANNTSLDTDFEWTDNVSWDHGKHSMKFGVDLIRDQIGGQQFSNTMYGEYGFTGIYTGDAYADFLLGIPQTTSLTVPNLARHERGFMFSMYAQDSFRVLPNLTVNYGLRWQPGSPYHDRYGTIANFYPAIDGWVVPNAGVSRLNPLYPTDIPVVPADVAGYPTSTLLDSHRLEVYPRIGIAYRPSNSNTTVIRAAYGIYGNPVYGGLVRSLEGGPFTGSVSYFNSITNGVPLFSFPDPFLPTGKTASQNAFGVNPHLRTPYTQQWNLTVERQLGQAVLRISYVGSHSVNLIYSRNLNQPHASTTPYTPADRPYQNFQTITWRDNGGDQEYNGLQVSVAKNFGNNLTFNAGWTWSRDLTDVQLNGSVYSAVIQNQYDLAAEWGPNLITPIHRVYGTAVYQLPFGTGQRFANTNSHIVNAIIGGWQMAWAVLLQSGQPFTPSFSGFDVSNTNTLGGRPDKVPGVSPSAVGKQSITNWFNPAAFKIPGCPDNNPVCAHPADVGRFGNLGVGTLRGPAIYNADLAVSKFFNLPANLRLQLQANAVDVFNHPNFGLPASNISSPGTVGHITSQIVPSLGSNKSRTLNLMARINF